MVFGGEKPFQNKFVFGGGLLTNSSDKSKGSLELVLSLFLFRSLFILYDPW
jgi:hypothetical protein